MIIGKMLKIKIIINAIEKSLSTSVSQPPPESLGLIEKQNDTKLHYSTRITQKYENG